jgi:phosphoglycolate phosphatase
MLKNIDSIIFDLDGTLWDATGTVAKAWQAAIDQVDFVQRTITKSDIQSITGMQYDAIFEKLFPELTDAKREEFKAICAEEELAYLQKYGGELYPGLAETLQALHRKYKLFIVSNCQSGYIEMFLSHSKLHTCFADHECYGTAKKPKAENIKAVIQRNKLQASVYVGDTKGDYEASKGAGVPFIFAAYGFGSVENGQVASITQVQELEEIL